MTVVVAPAANNLRRIETALRRVPYDERDWRTVALAISLNDAILTADNDSSAAAAGRGPSRP